MRTRPLMLLLAACGTAEPPDPKAGEAFPRCDDVVETRRPLFGDLHVHTARSLDANLQGTRLTPADAYRFAKGETVGLPPVDADGNPLRSLTLTRPLDFAAVTDHAEFLGAVALCSEPGSEVYDHADCVTFRDNPDLSFITLNGATTPEPQRVKWPLLCGDDGALCRAAGAEVWTEIREAADAAYDRTGTCGFTTFVGYEWSAGPGARNLHRNVIFRHDAVPEVPASYFDAPFPEDLWSSLRRECLDTETCDVLAIPHNSNLSSGLMFPTFEDAPDAPAIARAEVQAMVEPLVEIFQHKGDSECWPGSPVADELCAFESLPYNTLSGANLGVEADPEPRDFVRDTLGEGLRWMEATGVNPYRFGILASTDTHLGTPGAAEEAGYPGHGGAGRANRDALPEGLVDDVWFNPGGLAGVWAEENSREGIWRAMARRETFGTSGPRIALRVFAGRGWEHDLCDLEPEALAARGYAEGVPMGGDLPAGEGPPTFVVWAEADDGPGAAKLERLQLIAGRLSEEGFGVTVHDVAGETLDVGPDPATCAPSDAGEQTLCAVFRDTDHDAERAAFWYARALETPTCRWQTRACVDAGIRCPTDDGAWSACCRDDVPDTVRERAWSSPVWWAPQE